MRHLKLDTSQTELLIRSHPKSALPASFCISVDCKLSFQLLRSKTLKSSLIPIFCLPHIQPFRKTCYFSRIFRMKPLLTLTRITSILTGVLPYILLSQLEGSFYNSSQITHSCMDTQPQFPRSLGKCPRRHTGVQDLMGSGLPRILFLTLLFLTHCSTACPPCYFLN